MGYSCPVCGDPQADDEHLANHLAITAMIRGGDHEAFLDDHVPEWESMNESELGEQVVELAAEEEYPQVFEDTTGQDHAHGQHHHAHEHDHAQRHDESAHDQGSAGHSSHDDLPPGANRLGDGNADGVPGDILTEAQELTRKRQENAEDGAVDGDADDDSDSEDA